MAKQATPHNVRLSGPFPLHRGPFLFAPEFLSESDWYPNFQALIGEILFRRGIAAKLFRARARVARVEFGRFDMTINGQRGTFSVQSANAEYSELDAAVDDQLAPTGPPAHFLKQLRDPYVAEYLHDDFTEIKWLAEDLIRQMRERFQKALEAGNAELTAHVGKLSSLPVRLDFRLLQRLSLRPPKPDPDYRSGCADWQQLGLAPPERVQHATADYLGEQDTIGDWVDFAIRRPHGDHNHYPFLNGHHRF
jgi:hypothetical protein